jgi:tRNA G18 (ribose-2'-O)-methylase SpoU
VPVFRITDAADERLRDYVGLKDVSLRSRHEPTAGLYIAESASVIERALEAGHRPRSFLMSDRWLEAMTMLLGRHGIDEHADVPIYVGEPDVVNGVAGFNVHRGALAAMHRPVMPSLDELLESLLPGRRRIVVLEDIVDHTNVGAIFRSCAGLGADAVLVSPRCADPLYRRSVRVSMGTVFQVRWTRIVDWAGSMESLRAHGFVVAALALSASSTTLDSFGRQDNDRVALVLGAEGDGLSSTALATSDVVVRIPMAGAVDSLNVAAASAVALWALRD